MYLYMYLQLCWVYGKTNSEHKKNPAPVRNQLLLVVTHTTNTHITPHITPHITCTPHITHSTQHTHTHLKGSIVANTVSGDRCQLAVACTHSLAARNFVCNQKGKLKLFGLVYVLNLRFLTHRTFPAKVFESNRSIGRGPLGQSRLRARSC